MKQIILIETSHDLNNEWPNLIIEGAIFICFVPRFYRVCYVYVPSKADLLCEEARSMGQIHHSATLS